VFVETWCYKVDFLFFIFSFPIYTIIGADQLDHIQLTVWQTARQLYSSSIFPLIKESKLEQQISAAHTFLCQIEVSQLNAINIELRLIGVLVRVSQTSAEVAATCQSSEQ